MHQVGNQPRLHYDARSTNHQEQNNVSQTKRLAKTNYLNACIFSLGFDLLVGRTRPRHISCSVTIGCNYRNLDIASGFNCGPGSLVGIATGYGLDGPGIESWWGRDFPHLSRPALGTTQPPVQWVPGLSRRYRETSAWSWPLTPFQCCGHERVELYPYSPYGPYGLCRASVPVQRVHFTTLPFYPQHFSQCLPSSYTAVQMDLNGLLCWAVHAPCHSS